MAERIALAAASAAAGLRSECRQSGCAGCVWPREARRSSPPTLGRHHPCQKVCFLGFPFRDNLLMWDRLDCGVRKLPQALLDLGAEPVVVFRLLDVVAHEVAQELRAWTIMRP